MGYFLDRYCQEPQSNDISVAVLLGGEIVVGNSTRQPITIMVYVNDVLQETFSTHQEKSNSVLNTENDHFNKTGFVNIRTAVNGHSTIIEMTPRSYDVEDVVNIDPNNVVGFDKTHLQGASGGPSDDSLISTIRTGPDSTLIGLTSTENDVGGNVAPPSNDRIKKWDGSNWVPAQ